MKTTKITIAVPEEKITYRPFAIGDYFLNVSLTGSIHLYILSQPLAGMLSLINVDTGHRWADPVKVNDVHSVNQDEIRQIMGKDKDFVHVENIAIVCE